MTKSREYIYEDVIDIQGKKLGYVKDILVDFGKKEVLGFRICPYKFMKSEFNIFKEDIVYSKSQLVVKGTRQGKYLQFGFILNMHVVDKNSNMLGLVSEILFDKNTFKIQGLIIKNQSVFTMLKKRKIILINELIIGENYILYTGDSKNITMECTPSFKNSNKRDMYYEKD